MCFLFFFFLPLTRCNLSSIPLLLSGPCLGAFAAGADNILEWRGGNKGKVHKNSIF